MKFIISQKIFIKSTLFEDSVANVGITYPVLIRPTST